MLKKFIFYCNALMLLTSIHHVFGAYQYISPWRFHVLAFSIPVILLNVLWRKKLLHNWIAFYLMMTVNFIVTLSLIGFYEGVYNHLVKVVLYFSGTSAEIMTNLFPPPKYVMPDNFIFEFTGVLQAFLCIPIGYYFVGVVRSRLRSKWD
jgi:hypothetical protein